MKTEIKVTGFELTPAISSYVADKMVQIDKFVDPTDESAFAEIEIGKTTSHHRQGDFFRAEINLRLAGQKLRVQEELEDLYAALDKVKDDLVRQITSRSAKKQTLFRRGARKFKDFVRGFRRR